MCRYSRLSVDVTGCHAVGINSFPEAGGVGFLKEIMLSFCKLSN
jgi:hypothetical protein